MNKKILMFFALAGGMIFFSQSCKKKDDGGNEVDPIEEAYKKADGILGGQYYDEFYSLKAYKYPDGIDKEDIEDFGNFYRCKQCHGWDLDGKEGAYIGRKANEGRPEVAGSIRSIIKKKDKKELFDLVKNTGGRKVDPDLTQDGTNGEGDEHPDYGTILTDAEIWNIVKFLREEAFDVDDLYKTVTDGEYPNGTVEYEDVGKGGDADKGEEFYEGVCGEDGCHGDDGKETDLDGKTLGYYMRKKPYETQHKAKFGHAGDLAEMPAHPDLTLDQLRNVMKAMQDDSKFPD